MISFLVPEVASAIKGWQERTAAFCRLVILSKACSFFPSFFSISFLIPRSDSFHLFLRLPLFCAHIGRQAQLRDGRFAVSTTAVLDFEIDWLLTNRALHLLILIEPRVLHFENKLDLPCYVTISTVPRP